MNKLLDRPFPFLHEKQYLLFWLIELFAIVIGLEYFLEPFTRNYSEHRYAYWIICAFHSGVVTCCYLLAHLAVHLIGRPDIWRYRHEARMTLAILSMIGVGNFLIRDLIYDTDNWRGYLFVEEMVHGYLAGTLFYLMIIQLNTRILAHFTVQQAELNSTGQDVVRIEATVAADSFSANPGQILCIKSDGNYAVVYIKNGDKVEHRLIRQTMDSLEEQLSNYPIF